MASSTKVHFNLEKLREKALESIDFRISSKRLEVESHEDEAALAQRIATWRQEQEERLVGVTKLLANGDIDNHRLSRFKLDPIPTVDGYDRSRAERELRSLEATRTQILAKGSSLVADVDGNVSLTSTQLSEFFGL